MPSFRLSSGLLLATCFLIASVASTERVISCDDVYNVQHIRCDTGVISVQSSLYGRADREICSEGRPYQELDNTECSQHGTVDVIRRRCNGKKVCEIKTSVVHTSDPCSGIFKYLETNYTCLPANHIILCEHSTTDLYCDEGQVIFVYGAYYGRTDMTTCAYKKPTTQIENVSCSSHTGKVAEMCIGRNSCTIRASNSVFGDPCRGTFKYLEVAYVCEYPGLTPEQF